MSKGSAIVGFLLCFLAGMGLMYGVDRGAGHHSATADISKEKDSGDVFAAGAWSDGASKVPISSKDPSWGKRNAPVTIVIFSDYQCPFCSRVEPTIHALEEKYGPDKLRVVWKHFPLPFHKKATPAHAAAAVVYEVAGNKAFWKFHETLFENQKALEPASFEKWAVAAGVDAGKFKAAMAKDNAGMDKVNDDMKTGKAASVRGTPAFLINGIFLSGAQPRPKFEQIIDEQLKEAEKLIASGTKPDKVYVALSNSNFKAKKGQKDDDKKPAGRDEDSKTVWKVPVIKGDPVKGPKHALVTIVEFSDFQCPFCKKVEPTIEKIMETYGDKVRIVWKDNPLPFHKRANPAAQLAREAWAQKGLDGYWKAHAFVFENNKKLEDEDLLGYAATLGLDVEKAKAAIAESKYQAPIDAAQELASDMNAGGTPHFFVNGRRLVGAQPFEKFKEIIDEEIPKSEALLKGGIKLDKLYEEIIKKGKEPPPPEKKDVGPAPKDAPWKGAAKAKVIIQEFSDFECPFCSKVNPTLKQVEKEFGDKVKIVWRHKPLPFHKKAPLAHQASHEAFLQKGNDGFWAMHDKLFANQKKLERESLDEYAAELGLDMTKFKAALDGEKHKAHIDGDAAASTKAGISGTPGFVINGYFLSGAQPYAKFKKAIQRALKEAK